jgi:tetratricopeptide (TPR) repeat protein
MNRPSARRYCCFCGTRLARDNTGVHCAPCEKRAQALRARPPDVPPEFWTTGPMREALASRHMGRVIAAYRKHPFHGRLISQEIVGGWVRISQAQVSRIETNKPIKDLDHLIQWAKLLGIPEDLLWFKLPSPHQTLDDLPAESSPEPSFEFEGETPLPVVDDPPSIILLPVPIDAGLPASARGIRQELAGITPTERSALLASGGGAEVGLPVVGLNDLRHIVAALDDAWRYFDGTVVEYFRGQLLACAGDDGAHGPRKTLPVVLGVIGALESNARRVKSPVRAELLTVAAQGAEFAGWLYRDIGVAEVASYWRQRAIEWAQEAGDSVLHGYVLLKESQAAWDDRDADRMRTLAQAVQKGPWKLPPKVRAEAVQQEARGHAMLGGQLGLVERKLDEARELMADNGSWSNGQSGSDLGAHYDLSLLTAQTAICYFEAERPQRAVEIYQECLSEDTFSHRDYGYFLSLMALALAAAAEPDEAAKVGVAALSIASETKSARTVKELVRLLDRLAPWSDRTLVREFRDALLASVCMPWLL